MSIKVACPCGKKLSVKDEFAGRRIKCPECEAPIQIPKATATPASDDEWGNSDSEDESDVEAPSRSHGENKRRSGSGGARRGRSTGKTTSGSQRGLVIGVAAGGALLVVVLLVWLLWPKRAEENVAANSPSTLTGAETPTTATAPTDATEAQPMLTATGITSTSPPVGPLPVLPRAMTQRPEWWGADEPFDVAQFWVTVPPDQNAAPLYLDALYEFHPSVEACYPPIVRQQRTAAATQRFQRSYRMQVARTANPSQLNPAELDSVLADHAVGFKKLAAAQQRPRCVFEIGWDGAAQGPLLMAGREVARLGQLSVERDVAREDLDAAIHTTGIVLRFSRDLRVRTPLVTQFLADSIETITIASLVTPILQAPALKAAQCEALLRLLSEHDAELQKFNPALARLRGDYLLRRLLLHEAQHATGEFAPERVKNAFGRPCESVGAALFAGINADKVLADSLMTKLPPPQMGQMLDVVVRNMNAADYELSVRILKERYQAQASALGQSFAGQTSAFTNWQQKQRGSLETFMASVQSAIPAGTKPEQQAAAALPILEKKLAEPQTPRGQVMFLMWNSQLENDLGGMSLCDDDFRIATRRASVFALAALRRWYCSNSVAPTDLRAVCKAAGLSDVPRDPYGTGPLKLLTFTMDSAPIQYERVRPSDKPEKFFAGECVIYSVGPDGVDDRAARDFGYVPHGKGDWPFTLGRPQSAFPPTQ